MGQPQEVHIRKLQEFYWSEEDPEGRGFVPLADALRKAGEFREAHRLLRDGLERHPDFLSGHVVAAWLSVDQEQLEEAESRFATALALDPRNIFALRGMAEVLLDRGEVESALRHLEVLLHEDPIDPDLPDRVLELRAEAEALAEATPDPDPDPGLSVWDDPDAVAEELNWDSAALQPDSSPSRASREPEEGVPAGPVVEDGEPMPALEDLDDALVTSTLGEIYLRQGLYSRAERVFEALLRENPENEHLIHRLDEARNLLQANEGMDGGAEGLDERPLAEDEIVPISALAPDDLRPTLVDDGDTLGEIVPIEALAPTEAVPIESLAPDRREPVSPVGSVSDEPIHLDVLAPAPSFSIDSLAPMEPISIDALAPDGPVSIDALVPDGLISIDALAPDEPISIEALAPDGPVSIEFQAPEASSPAGSGGAASGGEPGQDPTIDAFENWLENLR